MLRALCGLKAIPSGTGNVAYLCIPLARALFGAVTVSSLLISQPSAAVVVAERSEAVRWWRSGAQRTWATVVAVTPAGWSLVRAMTTGSDLLC